MATFLLLKQTSSDFKEDSIIHVTDNHTHVYVLGNMSKVNWKKR